MRGSLMARAAFAAVLATLVGCGGPAADAPKVAPVQGRVTRHGQPLQWVSVRYTPIVEGSASATSEEGSGDKLVPSDGMTNANGEYVLAVNRNLMGAVIGKHRVELYKADAPLVGQGPNASNVIPKEYNTETALEVMVPPEGLDGGAADFDLKF